MARWVMVIDLTKCIGCDRCVGCCSEGNQLPGGLAWRRIAQAETTVGGVNRRVFVPMSCMHCANPPCRDSCPTGATERRPDGIVDIDHDKCIGCGSCVVACPYFARTMVSPGQAKLWELSHRDSQPDVRKHFQAGVCSKCDMCRPKIEAGLKQGLVPGIDRVATPSCVNACLWGAIQFGDADDPDSTVSRLLRQHRTFRISEELGTEPSIYYLNNSGMTAPP